MYQLYYDITAVPITSLSYAGAILIVVMTLQIAAVCSYIGVVSLWPPILLVFIFVGTSASLTAWCYVPSVKYTLRFDCCSIKYGPDKFIANLTTTYWIINFSRKQFSSPVHFICKYLPSSQMIYCSFQTNFLFIVLVCRTFSTAGLDNT